MEIPREYTRNDGTGLLIGVLISAERRAALLSRAARSATRGKNPPRFPLESTQNPFRRRGAAHLDRAARSASENTETVGAGGGGSLTLEEELEFERLQASACSKAFRNVPRRSAMFHLSRAANVQNEPNGAPGAWSKPSARVDHGRAVIRRCVMPA